MKVKDKITFEVGGNLFTTTRQTLCRIPNSRLSHLDENDDSYDPNTGRYFFDRNPELFNWVLDAYRRGTVHFPHDACPSFVVEELSFWQITECKLAKCCWFWLKAHEMEYGIRDRIERTFTEHMYLQERWAEGCLKERVYLLLQEPSSSTAAKIWGILFLVVMTLSITSQALLTLPEFRTPVDPYRFKNVSTITNPKMLLYFTTKPHPVIRAVEYISTILFLLDILIRFATCPNRCAFFKCQYNMIDMLATLPAAFIIILVNVRQDYMTDDGLFYTVVVMAGLGVFRVLRLFKFIRHYDGVRVLFLALKASTREICLLLLLIAVGTLIFSTLIYFSEFAQEDDFHSIPIGFWWSIVTMTTVGYGDKIPRSGWGYVVGGLCAVSGMVFTGLPIPIIASNFNLYYTYAKTKKLMVTNTLREIRRKRKNGVSFCDSNSSAKSSPSSAKVSPSSSIQSIDLTIQNKEKNEKVYSDVIRELSDINEGEEFKTDTLWTHMKQVAPVNK